MKIVIAKSYEVHYRSYEWYGQSIEVEKGVCVCAYVKNTSVQDKYAVVCDYCEINGAVRQHKQIIAEIKAWKMARERLDGK